jgi:hypothetical protein
MHFIFNLHYFYLKKDISLHLKTKLLQIKTKQIIFNFKPQTLQTNVYAFTKNSSIGRKILARNCKY